MWEAIVNWVLSWFSAGFARDLFISISATLIAAPIVALVPQLLRKLRTTERVWIREFAQYALFLALLGVLLRVNASTFDLTEWATLGVFLVASLLFESFLGWKAIHPQDRAFLRVMYNAFVIYVCLHATSTLFDFTEVLTLIEFVVLNILYEAARQRGKKTESDNIRYEINRKIDHQQLKGLLSTNEIELSNPNRILSRSFIHVAAFIDAQIVGFVNLIWSGEGPAEVDYLAINPKVQDVTMELVDLLEKEADVAGIREVQISNKVIRQNTTLPPLLAESDFRPETCLVKDLRGYDSEVTT